MDKAKIMRLCNEIEDEVTDIAFNSTHKHIYDCCESIREYLKAIAAEITAPPKSNADRIRQMTDEELAKFMCLVKDKLCFGCSFSHVDGCEGITCEEARKQWLKQEVSEDASD